jgi:N-acetylglutamate synthase-like GNAT family acetyltransferase
MIEDILINRYGDFIDGLDIYENATSLILSRIIIKPDVRQEGIGSKIMKDLINYADKNKQIIALTPSSDFGGNKSRLIQFYKKFGFKHNQGHYKSFEFRDSMIRYPRTMAENTNKIKGGLSDNMTKKDIANKFGVTLKKIEKEIKLGIKVEMEHVNDADLAKEIAMDHLVEIPDYYTRLSKMETEANKKWNIKESTKTNIKRLLRENVELSITDKTSDISIYTIIYNTREIGSIGVTTSNDMARSLELVFVQLRPDYNNETIFIMGEVIMALWQTFPDISNILLTPQPKSRTFWHKIGANRLNDSYLMISKGH